MHSEADQSYNYLRLFAWKNGTSDVMCNNVFHIISNLSSLSDCIWGCNISKTAQLQFFALHRVYNVLNASVFDSSRDLHTLLYSSNKLQNVVKVSESSIKSVFLNVRTAEAENMKTHLFRLKTHLFSCSGWCLARTHMFQCVAQGKLSQ